MVGVARFELVITGKQFVSGVTNLTVAVRPWASGLFLSGQLVQDGEHLIFGAALGVIPGGHVEVSPQS